MNYLVKLSKERLKAGSGVSWEMPDTSRIWDYDPVQQVFGSKSDKREGMTVSVVRSFSQMVDYGKQQIRVVSNYPEVELPPATFTRSTWGRKIASACCR